MNDQAKPRSGEGLEDALSLACEEWGDQVAAIVGGRWIKIDQQLRRQLEEAESESDSQA
jgi:hypothetical protein